VSEPEKVQAEDLEDADSVTLGRSAGELLTDLKGQEWFLLRASEVDLQEMEQAIEAYDALVASERALSRDAARREKEESGCGHRIPVIPDREGNPRPGSYQCGCGRHRLEVITTAPSPEG